MVPNSLGPGELLMHYGTDEQKRKWLPGLVDGSEIPCFGLTGPEVGSDATAMPDVGYVCLGEHDGTQTLGIKLTLPNRSEERRGGRGVVGKVVYWWVA